MEQSDKLNENIEQLVKKSSGWQSFLNGICFSIGTTLGAIILIFTLAMIGKNRLIKNMPFIESKINKFIQNYQTETTVPRSQSMQNFSESTTTSTTEN